MDAIRELTHTINTFVRFFESINCLFWQIDWLRRNVQGTGSEQMTIVLVVIVVCIYLTFFSYQVPLFSFFGDNSNSVIVGALIFGLVLWLIYSRYHRGAMNSVDSRCTNGDDKNLIPADYGLRTVPPAYQYTPFPGHRGGQFSHLRTEV